MRTDAFVDEEQPVALPATPPISDKDGSDHSSDGTSKDDDKFNPRKHPLYYPGADAEWFRPVHIDRHGKEWCIADAALIMQAGARGFISRRRRRLAAEAARRVFETVYAIKIQRCWRIAKARRIRRAVIGNMS